MFEYSKMNVKLSDTQLKKLKTAVKNKTGTTMTISLKVFHGNDWPHELLLTTRQKAKLRNAFNSNMSPDLKLSKVQISQIIQSGGFLGQLICRLTGLLQKVAIHFVKNVLAPLGITVAASAIDAVIQKNIQGSGKTLIISNEEMNDIMKIVQVLEDLLKGVTKTIKIKQRTIKRNFKYVISYFRR